MNFFQTYIIMLRQIYVSIVSNNIRLLALRKQVKKKDECLLTRYVSWGTILVQWAYNSGIVSLYIPESGPWRMYYFLRRFYVSPSSDQSSCSFHMIIKLPLSSYGFRSEFQTTCLEHKYTYLPSFISIGHQIK